MVTSAMRTGWLASGGTLKSLSICPRTLLNAHVSPSAPNSIIIHTQKRSLFASLGGTTALFVGASVLTVVETALFFIRHIVGLIVRRERRVRIVDFKP